MKQVPNNVVATLVRCLPLLLDYIDEDAIRKSLRATNAKRIIKHEVLPKLKKINNEKSI
jgi:hypothetical protein|nr:MAG TPA: hypothetical protein [Caudoviricetes sp.]